MTASRRSSPQTVVQVRRTLTCSPEQAFRAWTDPQLVPLWFKPRDGSGTRPEMDVRVGGSYRWGMEREGRVAYAVGEYLTVDPPSRLVFTFGWEQMPGIELSDSLVTVEFSPHRDGVEIVITHERLHGREECELHGQGWREMLANLTQHLVSRRKVP